ncbi:GMC oxidoreductase [Actinosynnema sp. NPDC047251]|uniref:Cholesterol oxidase n=1 Tax=Saccharothrix espanaensis (strain ATCC 51144 / DSM 44229 / JCM 9112 / NBRC 15066 / NRRL 15764) TaxID=1179773 RepID=K0JX84_SACES|nr:GMC oxidoreductase [Saccharothrix espanaensis]CCH30666.1 Cholesterol oxidase [Saccharothrix espanaensis DSM 44229]
MGNRRTTTTPTGRDRVDREEQHGAVIIGSGVGGSVTAFRLAEAGVDNLVLERGRRWPITPAADTFPRWPSPDKRLLWVGGRPPVPLLSQVPWLGSVAEEVAAKLLPRSTGLLDVLPHRNLTMVCGAGVGGGTLVYGGMLPQPRAEAFQRAFPPELDYEEFDRTYYPRARDRLGGTEFPDDLLARSTYRSAEIWRDALVDAGLPLERVTNTYDFDVVRAELNGTARASVTIGQYLFTGCNSGAKLSIDRTYLARAEATGRTEVRPLHEVTKIGQHPNGRYHLVVDHLDIRGTVLERVGITCDRLVLAAGGVHTPRMLVTAKATGQLPRLNEFIGGQWGTNGDQMYALKVKAMPAGGPHGGPPAFLTRSGDGMALVTHGGAAGLGKSWMLCPGMGIPDRFGRWTWSTITSRPRLEWARGSDASTRQATRDLMRQVARNIDGGATVHDPFATHPLVLHPLGGVVLNKATDAYGRLHGYDGLYCLDSALMPGCTAAVNPVLTIAAVVERCLDHIVDDFT